MIARQSVTQLILPDGRRRWHPEYPNNYQGIYIAKEIFSAAILLIRIMNYGRNSVVLLLLTKPVKARRGAGL
jgi:hypothetical protein